MRNPRRERRKLAEIIIQEGQGLNPGHKEAIRDDAVHILANEPMRWFYEESEQEYWNEREEFRNVAPIHELLWIEFDAPKFIRSTEYGVQPWGRLNWTKAGVLLTCLEKRAYPQNLQDDFPSARWICQGDVFSLQPGTEEGETIPGLFWTYFYGVDPDGRLSQGKHGVFLSIPAGVTEGLPDEARRSFGQANLGPLRIALLTLYFIHAKGTILKDEPGPAKQKKRKRKRKKRKKGEEPGPKIKFKVLDVGLGARQSLKQAKAEGEGSQKALRMHIRRGGFATYREEKPHVSGFVGQMWRRPSVVGKGPEEIKKEYRVRTRRKKREKREEEERDNPIEAYFGRGREPIRVTGPAWPGDLGYWEAQIDGDDMVVAAHDIYDRRGFRWKDPTPPAGKPAWTNPGTDARMRELERRMHSGDPEARQAFFREKARAREPIWIHDCDECEWLETDYELGLDYYLCEPPRARAGSFIARYGGDGPEYWSAPLDMLRGGQICPSEGTYGVPACKVAYRRGLAPTPLEKRVNVFTPHRPAIWTSPYREGGYGKVGYSELAMHTRIADQEVVQYCVSSRPPAYPCVTWAIVMTEDGRTTEGLPGEVLPAEVRRELGGFGNEVMPDAYHWQENPGGVHEALRNFRKEDRYVRQNPCPACLFLI
jgi:hypothetical protein